MEKAKLEVAEVELVVVGGVELRVEVIADVKDDDETGVVAKGSSLRVALEKLLDVGGREVVEGGVGCAVVADVVD